MNSKNNKQVVNLNWYPGHMAKTKREIKEKIDLIDIVIEVIDARIPLSSRNKDIDNIVGNKPRILVMSKIDLCDLEETNKWKKHYENLGYKVVMVDLLNNTNIQEILSSISTIGKTLNEKRKKKGLKERRARILILGIPNVGKSTLINRLVGKKATNVGNRPGVTKNLEWIRINKDIELLDTPGILWPKFETREIAFNLASMTAIKEEILDTEEVSFYIIDKLKKLYPNNLKDRYKLDILEDDLTIIEDIGRKIGAIRNKEVDYDRVYTTIMKDLREGYLGKVTFDVYNNCQ
jgi:ribosome biogenesis GTPase A